MLLSIIVPVYNAGIRIKKCLESLSNLKEQEIEFIIINDGSTDDTASYFKEYENKDKRFVCISKENAGVSATRNMGISLSKGKYITFIDADDSLTQEYNEIVEVLKYTEYEMYGFKHIEEVKDKRNIIEKKYLLSGLNNKETLIREIFAGYSNSVCFNIYKKALIEKEGIRFDETTKMGEDLLFNLDYIRHVDGIYFFDIAPYVYDVGNDSSAMHKFDLSYLDDYEKIYTGLVTLKKECGCDSVEIRKDLYLQQTYNVLKRRGRHISKEQEKRFRTGIMFNDLMRTRYDGSWKLELKRILLKNYAYKVFMP